MHAVQVSYIHNIDITAPVDQQMNVCCDADKHIQGNSLQWIITSLHISL